MMQYGGELRARLIHVQAMRLIELIHLANLEEEKNIRDDSSEVQHWWERLH